MKLEINIIVRSARVAADFYQQLFAADILSKTDVEQGMNETRMTIAGTAFRVLDENIDFGLVAPAEGAVAAVGFNLFVDDIYKCVEIAEQLGCTVLSPVTEFPEQDAINAVFKDIFGHTWVLNQ